MVKVYKMFKHIICTLLLSLTMSACSLGNASSVSPAFLTDSPATSRIPTTSTTTPPTIVAPTATSIAVAQNSQPIDGVCTFPNPNLPNYAVESGDTLSSIALRANVTIDEIVRLNCLDDTNLITVGQQLYIPNFIPNNEPLSQIPDTSSENAETNTEPNQHNTSQSIDLSNIPQFPSSYHGSIIPSSWIANHEDVYILEENATVRLTWSWFPTELGIVEVGFVIEPNNKIGGYTLVGTDTNLASGAFTQWTVPADAQYDIFAVGRIEGQQELIISDRIRIGSRNSNQPLASRVYGTTSVSPALETISPSEVVVDPNRVPITITWHGPTSFDYHLGNEVKFYYRDANGTSVLGADSDDSDGLSLTFDSYPTLSGVIYAEGDFIQSAPQAFHVLLKMPDIQIDTIIEGCQFYAFGIGAPHPILTEPDASTTVITEIDAMETYPVLQQGEFHQIELNGQLGWVESYRGQLIGDC